MSFHSTIEKHWVKRSIISYLVLPFAFLFSFIQRCRRFLYKHQILRSYHADIYVISVGNLTMGGNGKTPFTIILARALKEEGLKVVVSHRGYKGAYEHTIKIISDEEKIFPDAYCAGDEPMLLAENLHGIPVIVGSNRKAAIQYVQENLSPDVIILDDSFQHLKVHRDFDFLLFKGKNPVGNGFVAPAGMLRESADVMKYADCFVVNDVCDTYSVPKLFNKYSTPLFTTSYKVKNIIRFKDSQKYDISSFKGKKVILVSAIGNPASFEANIHACGCDIVQHAAFRDHHDYTGEDVAALLNTCLKRGIDTIITTEKDFVKLRDIHADLNNFYYTKLDVKINEMDTFRGIVQKLKKDIGT